jgi:cell division cycle 14
MDIFDKDGNLIDRDFDPAYYVDILRQLNVAAVIRLNGPRYNKKAFTENNISVVDLEFDAVNSPSLEVIAKFLIIVDSIPGALAIHCDTGLERTGALVALYMMKNHGFTAREAIGWLRIVRPGSVGERHEQYLCEMEPAMRHAGQALKQPADSHSDQGMRGWNDTSLDHLV